MAVEAADMKLLHGEEKIEAVMMIDVSVKSGARASGKQAGFMVSPPVFSERRLRACRWFHWMHDNVTTQDFQIILRTYWKVRSNRKAIIALQ